MKRILWGLVACLAIGAPTVFADDGPSFAPSPFEYTPPAPVPAAPIGFDQSAPIPIAPSGVVAYDEPVPPAPPAPPEAPPVQAPPVILETAPPVVEVVPPGAYLPPQPPPATESWQAAPVARAPRLRRAPPPPWRLQVEAGFSLLDEPEGNLGSPAAGLSPLSWDVNDYTPALGGRVTLSRCLWGADIEGRLAYYGGWEDDSRQTGAFGFANVFGQSPTATTTLVSEADLLSGELNYWRDLQEGCSTRFRYGVGLRYINFEESAEARNWVGLAPDSFLNGEADNEFLGGQLMGAYIWEPAELLTVALSAKAFFGVMGRDIIIDEVSILSGGRKRATNEDSEFSWGLELGIDASWAINNCLSLTLGYSALYLDEVVRGHDALDFSRGATGAVQAIQVTDSIWVHSLWLGLAYRF